jgi:hypothetical protein
VTSLIVVSGPTGVGKTTVAWEMVDVLEERDVPFGFFDPDLIHFRPFRDGDRFNTAAWEAALRTVWPLMEVERLIVPLVIEERQAAERILPGAALVIARLTASEETVGARLRKREIGAGPGFDWHLARAQELEEHWRKHPVEDFLVETDNRSVRDIALEVLTRSGWI